MAFELTQLQSVTDDWYEKQLNDIWVEDSVLLWSLMAGKKMQENFVTAGEKVDGGQKIRVFLEYGKANVSDYGAATEINNTPAEIINAARFRWAGKVAWNSINLDEQVQNSGKAALVDLAYAKLDNIQKSIREEMGSDVYASAANADAILGLGNLFNATTSAEYGSIREDDMAQWKANVITTARAIGFTVLQEIRRAASINQSTKGKPNLYITTELLKDAYEAGLQVQARYQDTRLASAGFANVLFGGVPVVADDKQTTGVCDALNLPYLKMKTHRKYAFTKPTWRIFSESQPDLLVANTRWVGQLVCSNRKAHCRHTNLTAPA